MASKRSKSSLAEFRDRKLDKESLIYSLLMVTPRDFTSDTDGKSDVCYVGTAQAVQKGEKRNGCLEKLLSGAGEVAPQIFPKKQGWC